MYRTDKQFMKNPATAAARIYIGNLAETVVPSSLEEKFGLHGKILGLVVQRGFGFIQFENEAQAKSAIINEHGTNFYGRKINVKQAIDNTKTKPGNPPQHNSNFTNTTNQNNFSNNQNNFQRNQSTTPQKDEQKPQIETTDPETFIGPQQPGSQPQQPSSQSQQQQQQHQPQQQQQQHQKQQQLSSQQQKLPTQQQNFQSSQQNENVPAKHNHQDDGLSSENRFNKRNNKGRPSMKRDYRGDVPSSYYDSMSSYNNTYQPPILDRPERNDCEIIVVSKALTGYAEFIEQQLKSLGLIVDLLFPNEDVPIGRVLANISSRGCLYSILVMPQNEEHRSLTLNILHGIPEEHRNMPIEDAFVLIIKNFESYMRGEKYGSKVDPDKMTLTSKHPENLQVIINLIAENRQVTSSQYDKLINYLQEKRDLQSQFEIAEGIETGIEPESKSKQAELQSRIMNILNKKAEDIPQKIVEPESNSTPLLNDPSVQKALDSLMLGDMFKGLAS